MTYEEKFKQIKARASVGKYDGNFTKDCEELFEIDEWPQSVKNLIHSKAWEDGHSAGYMEVVNHYYDLVELARVTAESLGYRW